MISEEIALARVKELYIKLYVLTTFGTESFLICTEIPDGEEFKKRYIKKWESFNLKHVYKPVLTFVPGNKNKLQCTIKLTVV